jgi:signal transduction histidine kinase
MTSWRGGLRVAEERVTALASRVAGLRLSAIIVVLLIPIMLLSYLMVQSKRSEIAFAERQAEGVLAADALMQVLLGLGAGRMDTQSAAKGLGRVMPLAERAGVDKAIAALQLRLAEAGTPLRERLEATAAAIEEVGTNVRLVLDPNAETHFLAQVNLAHLPGVVLAFHTFETELNVAIETQGIDQAELKKLLLGVGRLAHVVSQSLDMLRHAAENSDDSRLYDNAQELFGRMKRDIDVTIDVVAGAAPGSEAVSLSMLARQNLNTASKFALASTVWGETSTQLSNLLADRQAALQKHLYGLMAISGLCVFGGVASALWMFSSTLRRLDLVDQQRQKAEAAQEEAEQSRAETEKINAQVAKLNRELADKINSLREAQNEIVKKGRLEQMGQLTATIAHELRNPLGAVRTSAFLIERKIKGLALGLEPQMQRINNGIQRCDNIITQLLDYSRNKPLQCKADNLDEWLSRVVSEEAARLPQSIVIELALGLEDRQVPFDGARLQRAVINLLSNAAEALGSTEKDGEGPTLDRRIWVSTRVVDANTFGLRVRDSGPGISPENLARIREPLFTTKSFGTGLGIPAIEQIAHQHGGSLTIESRVGDGASFELLLPMKSRPATQEAA